MTAGYRLRRPHEHWHDTFVGVRINRNGARVAYRWCRDCEPSRGEPFHRIVGLIPKSKVGSSFETLPVVYSNERPDEAYPPCSVEECLRPGKERHHWAMSSVFGSSEARRWPVSALCREHHQEWHGTLVRLGLRYPANNDNTADCPRCEGSGSLHLWWKDDPALKEWGIGRGTYESCGTCTGRGWLFTDDPAMLEEVSA